MRSRGGRSRNRATFGEGAGCAAIAMLMMIPPGKWCQAPFFRKKAPDTILPLLSGAQAEELDRVLLEDQRTHLGAKVRLLEVREPAVGRDDRIVRAEQHLALQ